MVDHISKSHQPINRILAFGGLEILGRLATIGKKHALKKYDQFAVNTSCFWRSTGSNITPIVQFYEIFVTKIMNKLIYYHCALLTQKFRETAQH